MDGEVGLLDSIRIETYSLRLSAILTARFRLVTLRSVRSAIWNARRSAYFDASTFACLTCYTGRWHGIYDLGLGLEFEPRVF